MSAVTDALSWAQRTFGDKPAEAAPPASEEEAKAVVQAAFAAMRQQTERIAAVVAGGARPDRASADPRKQALYDAMYLIAAADGSVSPEEQAKLTIGLRGLLGEGFDDSLVQQGLENASALLSEQGVKGAAESVASVISDAGERSLLLTLASVSAWLGGGVGTKEGLALQALAAAFGIPINKLHEAMAAAAKIAKA